MKADNINVPEPRKAIFSNIIFSIEESVVKK
jgi:hypothetical protein